MTRIRKKGYLMVGYTFLKAFGTEKAIIFERLLTEFQHSQRTMLNFYDWFIIDFQEISFHTGISTKNVEKSILEFQKIGLIQLQVKDENVFIKLNTEEIIDFEQTFEKENNLKNWNYGLFTKQSQVEDYKEEKQYDRQLCQIQNF